MISAGQLDVYQSNLSPCRPGHTQGQPRTQAQCLYVASILCLLYDNIVMSLFPGLEEGELEEEEEGQLSLEQTATSVGAGAEEEG